MDGAGQSNDGRIIRNHFFTRENIVDLFQKYNVPRNVPFDFLSIDIDHNDFHVANAVLQAGYR